MFAKSANKETFFVANKKPTIVSLSSR